jgi:hypothetical protein
MAQEGNYEFDRAGLGEFFKAGFHSLLWLGDSLNVVGFAMAPGRGAGLAGLAQEARRKCTEYNDANKDVASGLDHDCVPQACLN